MKHEDLFRQVGIRPGRGILLHGPPGNGKTLLARAVAGESEAHIEIISGPELLSKWVGETERVLRETFERAKKLAPSVILMDEVDAIAGSRDRSDASHQRALVSQLLVLLDGIEDRGRVLIIATTNFPQAIDAALLRPGRIDRRVFLGQPNRAGRLAQLTKLFAGKPVAEDMDLQALATATKGLSGAGLAHLVNEAGLRAIKEAIAEATPSGDVRIRRGHFLLEFNEKNPTGKEPTEKTPSPCLQ